MNVIGPASGLTGPQSQSSNLLHWWDYGQGTRTNTLVHRISGVYWSKLSCSTDGLAWEEGDCVAFIFLLLPFLCYLTHLGTQHKIFLEAVVIFT